MSPGPAAVLLAGLAAAALLAAHGVVVGAIALVLLAVCLRAGRRARPYLVGIAATGGSLLLLTPLVESVGSHVLWSGPYVPVLGYLDVTREELSYASMQAGRLAAVSLAFAVYALLLDHDRLVRSARFARRSALAVALATRLVPTLERDAAGMVEALRGRGVAVAGARGYARLASPLLAGSLERGLDLAEAMEARGYGRPGATRAPAPRWGALDFGGVAAAVALVVAGATWL